MAERVEGVLQLCLAHALSPVSVWQDAEGMLSIQTEANEARASLADERELVKTYEVSN